MINRSCDGAKKAEGGRQNQKTKKEDGAKEVRVARCGLSSPYSKTQQFFTDPERRSMIEEAERKLKQHFLHFSATDIKPGRPQFVCHGAP